MKFLLAAFLLPLALATPTSPLAPLWKRGETIDDAYIVVFKKDVQPQQMALHLAGLEDWHAADVSHGPSVAGRVRVPGMSGQVLPVCSGDGPLSSHGR